MAVKPRRPNNDVTRHKITASVSVGYWISSSSFFLVLVLVLHRGVTHTAFDIEEIIDSADRKLFTRIIQPGHCLYHLLPPKTSAYCPYGLRKPGKDNILTNSLTSNSHSTKTVLSIDVYLNSDDWLDFIIFVVFRLSTCCYRRWFAMFLTFSFFNFFLIHCNSVRMSYVIKRLRDLNPVFTSPPPIDMLEALCFQVIRPWVRASGGGSQKVC